MDFTTRQKRLARELLGRKLSAMVVTHLPDVRYLCGFTGSNAALAVLVSGGRVRCRLFTDGRYTAQAAQEVRGATVRIAKGSVLAESVVFMANSAATRCGFDAVHTTVSSLEQMRKALRSESVTVKRAASFLFPLSAPGSAIREVKDDAEIDLLRRAAKVSCDLYEGMLGYIAVGMRELDVAAELEHRARLAGAEAMSFETIVASGVRSSMPHGRATAEEIKPGTLLTLDFGIMLGGYCSDMTRTVFLGREGVPGKAREKETDQWRVFHAVLEAQEAAVQSVREGVSLGDVDEAARSVLRRAGLAKFFTHSTGHGLGLEIHEGPRLAAKQSQRLQAGTVVTIEPGAYLPGAFGVRIEDTVLVTETGCEVLTPAYKGWIEL